MVRIPKNLERLTKAELINLIGRLGDSAASEGSTKEAEDRGQLTRN